MDELDAKIIAMLQEDARASNAGIARKVGVSEGTVRRRLKRLIQEGFMRVVATLDPGRMGYASEALIGVQVDPDKVDQVSDDLAQLEETNWVSIITGSFDIITWATLPSSEALGIFLRTKVGIIPGVRRTETFLALAVKKRGYGLTV